MCFLSTIDLISQEKVYKNTDSDKLNYEILKLNSDSTYTFTKKIYYDIGPVEDIIYDSGSWTRIKDSLFLKTFNSPEISKKSLHVTESKVGVDSTIIVLTSKNQIPLFLISPKRIRVNSNYYTIDSVNIEDEIRLSFPIKNVKHIIIPGYRIYKPEESTTNFFKVKLEDVDLLDLDYPSFSYFYNDLLISQNDTLNLINSLDSTVIKSYLIE